MPRGEQALYPRPDLLRQGFRFSHKVGIDLPDQELLATPQQLSYVFLYNSKSETLESKQKPLVPPYRREEHGEKVDHGLHVEAPLGSHAGRGQEHQAADCGKQHLGDESTHAAAVQRGTSSARLATVQSRGG